jgi:hypothetical protein
MGARLGACLRQVRSGVNMSPPANVPLRSAMSLEADGPRAVHEVAEVPCVDGSLLAKVFCTMQLVGCGHVFGLFVRFR